MVTLDTNVVIYHLKGDASAVAALESLIRAYTLIFISTVTETELFSSPTLTLEESERIEAMLPLFSIIHLDSPIARRAGELRRLHPSLKLADSVIAATALFTHSTLLTRNARDFKKISGLAVQPV
ncbi:MAG: type II toxin-antitoxin system VapC family toxin [Patescibacteria group bacterium]